MYKIVIKFVLPPPLVEARSGLMASYIDMYRCKLPDCGDCALNDASDEQATRTFGHFHRGEQSVTSHLTREPDGMHQ